MEKIVEAPDINEVSAVLGKIALFGGIEMNSLRSIVRLLKTEYYKKEQFIFRQGDTPGNIYIIASGGVKIVTETKGAFMELIKFSVGQCFGETSVIAIQPYQASAVADEDLKLWTLSRKDLFNIFNISPATFSMLILNIAREACRRLHKSDEILLNFVCK